MHILQTNKGSPHKGITGTFGYSLRVKSSPFILLLMIVEFGAYILGRIAEAMKRLGWI